MIELLLKLEMSLWVEETMNNKEYLDKIIHNDFKEFGRSGKVYNKQNILDAKYEGLDAVFPFKDLQVKDINDSTFLVTYQSALKIDDDIQLSNRSSIWVVTETGLKLLFHQGTATK